MNNEGYMAVNLPQVGAIGFRGSKSLLLSVVVLAVSLLSLLLIIGICHDEPGYFSADWDTGSAILGAIYGICLAGIWCGAFFTASTLKDLYYG